MPRLPILLACFSTGVVALFPALAIAEVRSEMSAFIVTVDNQGVEQFTPASVVNPGELIEYRIVHTNGTEGGVGSLSIVGPVPDQTSFVDDSHKTSESAYFEIQADLDPERPGEEWSPLPAMRLVKKSDGSYAYEEVGPEEFTAVRWTLNGLLESEQSVENTYRIRVD